MPCDYSRYPADWKAIRASILERATDAGGVQRCEWCGVPNGELIDRHPDGRWILHAELDSMNSGQAFDEGWDHDGVRIGTRVVLTIAHLGTPHPDGRPGDKHDKLDVRPDNLAALCQKCHLAYDMDDHVRHAAETRRRKFMERTGQLALSLEGIA